MEMKEFAEVIKKSHFAGNNKIKIIQMLLKALGAKPAVSESAEGVYDDITGQSIIQSPSSDTIKKWFKGGEPDTKRYFPSLTVENKEEEAHKFLRKLTGSDKWIELRNLFKEWRDKSQSDEPFYINTETDDFHTFSTSFWQQFVSFFKSLRMWDDAEEPYQKQSIKDEMITIFKEEFIQYRVCEFIPKDIENVIESLYIYREIWDEGVKLAMNEIPASDCDAVYNSKKMYCKWFSDHDNFVFYAVVGFNGFWKLQIPGECILLKFPESFDPDMMPANTWMTESLEYAIVNPIPEDGKFDGEDLPWKECQGDIIFIDVDIPIKTSEDASDDEDCPIIEDCYVLIDGMLALDSLIDSFITIIKEEIIKKYEGVAFDNDSRQLYNGIKQYRKSLKKFKKDLIKFRNLEKEKSQYLRDQALLKSFNAYQAISDYESSPKPHYPFSECYLDPEEAKKVVSELNHYHQSLIKLFTEIICLEEDHTL